MSTGLLADHQQAFQFKKPSNSDSLDHHAFSSPNFNPSLSSSLITDPDLHSLNRSSPQFVSLDTAHFSSKFCSFNGELQTHSPGAPSPTQHSFSNFCSLDGELQAATATDLKPAASQLNASSTSQKCMDYVGSSSSSTSTPRSCTSNPLQKELAGDGDVVNQTAYTGDLRASECDFVERINEFRASLLHRSVSKAAAFMQQSGNGEGQGKSWPGEQQQAVGVQKGIELGDSFLCTNGDLQAYKQDFEGDPHAYLGNLRVAAASAGGLMTNPANQKASVQSDRLNQANQSPVGSLYEGGLSANQAQQAASLGGFNQASTFGAFNKAPNQDASSSGGFNEVMQALGGGFSKANQTSVNGFNQANLQGTNLVSSLNQTTVGGFLQVNQGNQASGAGFRQVNQGNEASGGGFRQANQGKEASASVFMPNQASQAASVSAFNEAKHLQSETSVAGSNQGLFSMSGFSQANQVAVPVGGLSQANQSSLGGFSKANQASLAGLGQANQSSVDSFDQVSLGIRFDQDNNQAASAGAILHHANQASAGGFNRANQPPVSVYNQTNQAVLLMEEGNSTELGEVQALHRSCGNGELAEMESLQEGGAAARSSDLLQADSFLGDLQASIMAQGDSLQRFLPSNKEEEGEFAEEEELQLGGALFGCDEFRMYEFKVRLCMRERSHDWTQCPFAHPGEKARRRDPRLHHYSAVPCPDFRKAACKRGDACELSHGVFECWLHPSRYRTQICKDGKLCKRKVCFFAHSPSQFRAISSNNSHSQMQIPSSPQSAHFSNSSLSTTFDGSSIRLPIQLIQHLPRYCQALLKHDPDASHLANQHLNISPSPNLLHHHLRHHHHGGVDAATPPNISYDGSSVRLAMAYGLPMNLDAAALEGLNNNGQLMVGPQPPPRCDSFDSSSFLQAAASTGGLACCKNTQATNYTDIDDFGIGLHTHSCHGTANSSSHFQSDGVHVRALQQASSMDGIARQYILNGEVCNGFVPINKLALGVRNNTHHVGLPNTGLHLPSHPPAPALLISDPPSMPSNASSSWNNPLLQRFSALNVHAAQAAGPSLDAVSQAQAVLVAHALAQNRALDHHHGHSTPSSVMSRHHLDVLNSGTQGAAAVNPLGAQNNMELISEYHLQNSMRGLDSPQTMSQLIASIQQLELRCVTAEMKNSLMMAQAAQQQSGNAINSTTSNSKAHQAAESWDGHEKGGPPFQRVNDLGGSMSMGGGMYGLLRQDAAMPVPDSKGSLADLGWVDELIY